MEFRINRIIEQHGQMIDQYMSAVNSSRTRPTAFGSTVKVIDGISTSVAPTLIICILLGALTASVVSSFQFVRIDRGTFIL